MKHGRLSTYTSGCRCNRCRLERTRYARAQRGRPVIVPERDNDWLLYEFPAFIINRNIPDNVAITALETQETRS